jgi:aminobenzoyl-glutamate utilization protein B
VLNGIWERIVNASKGAALGTGTTVDHEIIMSYWNVLSNETLAAVQHSNLLKVGGFEYTPEEQAFAEKLRSTVIGATTPMSSHEAVQPLVVGGVGPASTDMGDISWNVPTVQLTAATFVPGVPAHSWQAVACTGMSIGFKGMMVAAKTLALTTAELFQSPATLEKARAEFLKKRGSDFTYTTIASEKPPLNYRKGS